jgi:two-component system, cell cycle sensor histidine kinase and response regulator CckA
MAKHCTMKIRLPEFLLRHRLFWIFSGVFPLVAFAALMIVVFTQQQENSIARLLAEAGERSSLVAERAIAHQIAILEGLSMSRDLDTQRFDTFRIEADRLKALHPEWRTVILTDESVPLLNLAYPQGRPIPPLRDPRSLRQVWESKKPFVGDLANGFVAVRVPVVRGGDILYTLVAPTNPQYFREALQASSQTKSWWYVIVGSDGIVISASPELGIKTGKPFVSSSQGRPASARMTAPFLISPSGWRIYVAAPPGTVEMPFTIRRVAIYSAGSVAALASIFLVVVLGSAWYERQESMRLHREIEDRKAAQKALQESEQRFRQLVENAPDAIFLETNDRFIYLNHAALELFGASRAEELTGRLVVDFFHEDSLDSIKARIPPSDGQKPISHTLLKCLKTDGSAPDVDVSTVPLDFGGVRGVLFFLRDVTELLQAQLRQRELEEQLYQAQRMESVGRLAGGVAHDYNNSLTVITGYTELALSQLQAGEILHTFLSEVHKAAQRSTEITRQLLGFARKQTILPVVLDLNDTIEGMLEMIRRLIGENIELTWRPLPPRAPVRMDPGQISQILTNLCANARDAITDVGRISIETDSVTFTDANRPVHLGIDPGEFVRLVVTDNGCGMDEATLSNIFEPFFTTKGVGEGTGLGVPTIYGIVKQNNGFIDIRSKKDQGTVFTIYLPRYDGSISSDRLSPAEDVPRGNGEILLIVEDDGAILELAGRLVTDLGYSALSAQSPAEALRIAEARSRDISLVITDVALPEMNGRELVERIRTINPSIKSLLMSGHTADIIAHRGIIDSGENLLEKPFSLRSLAEKVRMALTKTK